RFHSNSEILIENSGGTQPVFYGKVTTAGGVDTSRSSRRVRRGDVFLGGLDTQSPRIVLPRRFAPVDGLDADDAEVIELDGDAHVVFRADGSYLLRVGEGGHTTAGRLSAMPTYFVAAQKSTVGVKGTL